MVSTSISTDRFVCIFVNTISEMNMQENTIKIEIILIEINFLLRLPIIFYLQHISGISDKTYFCRSIYCAYFFTQV